MYYHEKSYFTKIEFYPIETNPKKIIDFSEDYWKQIDNKEKYKNSIQINSAFENGLDFFVWGIYKNLEFTCSGEIYAWNSNEDIMNHLCSCDFVSKKDQKIIEKYLDAYSSRFESDEHKEEYESFFETVDDIYQKYEDRFDEYIMKDVVDWDELVDVLEKEYKDYIEEEYYDYLEDLENNNVEELEKYDADVINEFKKSYLKEDENADKEKKTVKAKVK